MASAKQLQQEINALMRRAEILDAQGDQRYGKGNLGSKLPNELRYEQSCLEKIRQAREEMEAETGAAANTRPGWRKPQRMRAFGIELR